LALGSRVDWHAVRPKKFFRHGTALPRPQNGLMISAERLVLLGAPLTTATCVLDLPITAGRGKERCKAVTKIAAIAGVTPPAKLWVEPSSLFEVVGRICYRIGESPASWRRHDSPLLRDDQRSGSGPSQ
jgi:hypothetical protein